MFSNHLYVPIKANKHKNRVKTKKITIKDSCCWYIHSSKEVKKLRSGVYDFEDLYVKIFESKSKDEC